MMEPARPAGSEERAVEIPVPVLELVGVRGGRRAKLLLDLGKPVIRRDHVRLPGIVTLQDRLAQRFHLNKLPGLGEVRKILKRYGGHPEAALLLGRRQRFASSRVSASRKVLAPTS